MTQAEIDGLEEEEEEEGHPGFDYDMVAVQVDADGNPIRPSGKELLKNA